MVKLTCVAVLVAVMAALSAQVDAWGSVGHQVVAGIAEARLTNKAYTAVNRILNGASLVCVGKSGIRACAREKKK